MEIDINEQILYYATSTSAQVWAAFLVFQVLLMRDLNKARVDELESLREKVLFLIPDFLRALRNINSPSLGSKLSDFEIEKVWVKRFEVDHDAFKSIMKKARHHKMGSGVPSTTRDRVENFSPIDVQEKIDAVADRIDELDVLSGNAKWAFVTGICATTANMILLLTLSLLSPRFGWGDLVLIDGLINLGFGYAFVHLLWPALKKI